HAQRAAPVGLEVLRRRAAGAAFGRERVAEADRDGERAVAGAGELRMAREGAETDAVPRDPDREAIDPPGGSHEVFAVTEPEHAGPLRDEATGGNLRAEDLVATRGADLEEDVLAERVHGGQGLGGEHGPPSDEALPAW